MRTSSAIDRRKVLVFLAFMALGLDRSATLGHAGDPPAKKALVRPPVDPASVVPIDLSGRPDPKLLGDESRLVLWRDLKEGNLHILAVARGSARKFRGTIVALGGTIRDIEGVESLERPRRSQKGKITNEDTYDEVRVKADTLTFRFHTVGGKSEEITVRITPETTHLKLSLLVDGKSAYKQIFLGKAGAHPTKDIIIVPFEATTR